MAGQLRINGELVEAVAFWWDSCHKFYLVRDEAEWTEQAGAGEAVLPISALPQAWETSCGLRFISWSDLQGPSLVEQFETATVTYDRE